MYSTKELKMRGSWCFYMYVYYYKLIMGGFKTV